MESDTTTTGAARSWMDMFVRSKLHDTGPKVHPPPPGTPQLDISPTQTADQLAVAKALEALEKIKQSIA